MPFAFVLFVIVFVMGGFYLSREMRRVRVKVKLQMETGVLTKWECMCVMWGDLHMVQIFLERKKAEKQRKKKEKNELK